MSKDLTAFEALQHVAGWDPELSEIEELKGGLTNRTYLVSQDGRRCVLRLDSQQSTMFQFDRSAELRILETAHAAGIAPAAIYADPERSILVTEFLEGRTWDEADLDDDKQLEALGALLQRVHALDIQTDPVDVAAVARIYEQYLQRREGLHSFALKCVDIVESVAPGTDLVCCHNDIVAANVIEGEDIKLIDWEFSCVHDRFFDLASAIGFHNLDEGRSSVLLEAYTGGADAAARERLEEQVRVFDAVQWLWLATRQLVFPSRWQSRRLEELQQRID
jgi:thiamine kinase-like enzyme